MVTVLSQFDLTLESYITIDQQILELLTQVAMCIIVQKVETILGVRHLDKSYLSGMQMSPS